MFGKKLLAVPIATNMAYKCKKWYYWWLFYYFIIIVVYVFIQWLAFHMKLALLLCYDKYIIPNKIWISIFSYYVPICHNVLIAHTHTHRDRGRTCTVWCMHACSDCLLFIYIEMNCFWKRRIISGANDCPINLSMFDNKGYTCMYTIFYYYMLYYSVQEDIIFLSKPAWRMYDVYVFTESSISVGFIN